MFEILGICLDRYPTLSPLLNLESFISGMYHIIQLVCQIGSKRQRKPESVLEYLPAIPGYSDQNAQAASELFMSHLGESRQSLSPPPEQSLRLAAVLTSVASRGSMGDTPEACNPSPGKNTFTPSFALQAKTFGLMKSFSLCRIRNTWRTYFENMCRFSQPHRRQ